MNQIKCEKCGSPSYVRVDVKQLIGYGPGPDVRCVNCKFVWPLPRYEDLRQHGQCNIPSDHHNTDRIIGFRIKQDEWNHLHEPMFAFDEMLVDARLGREAKKSHEEIPFAARVEYESRILAAQIEVVKAGKQLLAYGHVGDSDKSVEITEQIAALIVLFNPKPSGPEWALEAANEIVRVLASRMVATEES